MLVWQLGMVVSLILTLWYTHSVLLKGVVNPSNTTKPITQD